MVYVLTDTACQNRASDFNYRHLKRNISAQCKNKDNALMGKYLECNFDKIPTFN
jgi:hypothetical protein